MNINYKQSLADKVNNGKNSPMDSSPNMDAPEGVPSFNSPKLSKMPANPKKKNSFRMVLAIVGLVVFFGLGMVGVFISQNQFKDRSAKAPTAPESKPAAFVDSASCTMTFTVTAPSPTPTNTPTPTATPTPTPTPAPNECGYTPCLTDVECDGALVCIDATDGESYCGEEQYRDRCEADPSVATCCEAEPTPTPTEEPTPTPTKPAEPTATPAPQACGYSPCDSNFDCASGLICVEASDNNNYCAIPDYRTACENSPSIATCCNAPGATPTTGTTTTTTEYVETQPDLPVELYQSGPENWLSYLQVGLGTLGVGALLLLFL